MCRHPRCERIAERPSDATACSAVLLALENQIEFSNAAACHCGLENLDLLFEFWHGRANGLTAALNIIKQNASVEARQ
jgi:hypothetical protein